MNAPKRIAARLAEIAKERGISQKQLVHGLCATD